MVNSYIYDVVISPIYGRARGRAIAQLGLQPGERLLIPGIGTSLDLSNIPPGVLVVGLDLSPDMLTKAESKTKSCNLLLLEMDAQALGLADAGFNSGFDALLFNLVLTVVPDGAAAFAEAWHTLKPGGRAVIFDKFLPEESTLTPMRRLLGYLISLLGTDPNRRLGDTIGGIPDLVVIHDEPDLLGGQYRIVTVHKKAAQWSVAPTDGAHHV